MAYYATGASQPFFPQTQMHNVQASYQFQMRNVKACSCCLAHCYESYDATFCDSCAAVVCTRCMSDGFGQCPECVETFPVSKTAIENLQQKDMSMRMKVHWPTHWVSVPATAVMADTSHEILHLQKAIGIDATHGTSESNEAVSAIAAHTAIAAQEQPQPKFQLGSDTDYGMACPEKMELITTLMICNIPPGVDVDDLCEAIDSVGFAGKYNNVHRPCRHVSRRSRRELCLPYAFVNFDDPCDAESFKHAFHGFGFPARTSNKRCTVKNADKSLGATARVGQQ